MIGENIKKLQNLLDELAEKWEIPGVIVSLIDHESVLFQGTHGAKDLDSGAAIDAHTVFQVGSITKSFTSALAGICADKGLLSLDAPVGQYVEGFAMRDPMATQRVTIADFLAHSAGLPSHNLFWHGSYDDRQTLFDKIRYLEPKWDIRSHWHYQNLNYLVSGAIMERVSGKTWEQLVQEELFEPLGMQDASIGKAAFLAVENRAQPYQPGKGGLHRNPPLDVVACAPAGAINLSNEDLNIWTRLHLNGGKHGEKSLITDQAMRAIHAPRATEAKILPLSFAEAPYAQYGLAWVIEPYRGVNVHYDGGNIEGFSGMSVVLPDEGLGITMQVNMHEANLFMMNLLYNMIDLLFFDDRIDWNSRLSEALTQYVTGASAAAAAETNRIEAGRTGEGKRPAQEYLGDYFEQGYGRLRVERAGDGIAIRYHDNAALLKERQTGVFELAHYEADRFTTQLASLGSSFGVTLEFVRGDDGRVSGVRVPFEPTVQSILFQKQA